MNNVANTLPTLPLRKLGVFVVRGASFAAIGWEVEIDTAHYRGNYPESVMVEGCYAPDASTEAPPLLALASSFLR